MAREGNRKEYHEGAEASERFERTLSRVLTVTKDQLTKREDTYLKSRADKNRPGPRRKSHAR